MIAIRRWQPGGFHIFLWVRRGTKIYEVNTAGMAELQADRAST